MVYKYESELLQVLHEEMMDMHRSGFITDAEMQEFDEICFGEEDETDPETANSRKKEEATAK